MKYDKFELIEQSTVYKYPFVSDGYSLRMQHFKIILYKYENLKKLHRVPVHYPNLYYSFILPKKANICSFDFTKATET